MLSNSNIIILLALGVAFLLSFSSTPAIIALAHKLNAIDVPKDNRRIHKKPIPLMGGLAIFYGFVISLICFGVLDRETIGIILGCSIIILTGIFDDIKNIKPITKLLFQLLAASVVVCCGVRIEFLTNPLSNWIGSPQILLSPWMSISLTIIWIVGICNAINLIDGLDGLAVGVSTISAFCMLALTLISNDMNVAIIAASVAGAALGFLPYNFNPAKIFMGDTGSLFLGFVLACISVQGLLKQSAVITFAVPVLILGLPIFDTAFAILRRIASGKSPMSPDRGHLHHRLIDHGFSQKQAVAILYTLTALLCFAAVVISIGGYTRGVFLILAVMFTIILSTILMSKDLPTNKCQDSEERLEDK